LRSEPIFRSLAEDRNPGRVLFSHNVSDFIDEGQYVLVAVQDNQGREQKYRCQYLIGADGGRFVGPKIGVVMEGPQGITDMVSIYFKADISEYWDDRFFACHFINGSCGTVFESGALVPLGPIWGRHCQEWVIHFGFELGDDSRFDEDKLVPRVRELLKLPDLEIEVFKISHWILERVLANKYSVGRVFLAGDAAHRRPPTTGLGLNTSIEDALNLAWKLAFVLTRNASSKILETYESERRPVGKRNCDWGLFTFKMSNVINAAVGLVPGQEEANRLSFAQLFEDSEIGRSRRAQVRLIADSQCIEFSAHDIELGFHYDEGLQVPDRTDAPESDPLGQIYVPTTRPGHRLPHAWVEKNNAIISTHDLVGCKASYLLITDAYGSDWVIAAHRYAIMCKNAIVVAQIGPRGNKAADVIDHDEQWERVKGLKRGGALLVRPDNFVAWRGNGVSRTGGAELVVAIQRLL
jgi:2,4-dichlorophenol 6-monooxygenase